MTRRACLMAVLLCGCAAEPAVQVGSKKFTESVILAELARLRLQAAGVRAAHREQLGGTRILWSALRRGDIDVYPEYTGTLWEEVFASDTLPETRDAGERLAHLRARAAEHGIGMTEPLGFANNYALGMRRAQAERLGVERISQLRDHPKLVLGFTNEFMDRADGWPGLRRHYDLPHDDVHGLDHDLAYRALGNARVGVTDLYSTDANIDYYDVRVLEDDRDFFSEYRAVLLYREALQPRQPHAVRALRALAGHIDAAAMKRMNARVKLDGHSEQRVAADFAQNTLGFHATTRERTWRARLLTRTGEHLALVGVSLGAAVLLAIPVGILAARRRRFGQLVLALVGIVQTIPALALLVFMIPPLGIGAPPAMAALFLYSLLPIVRNTHAGLQGIEPALLESAEALGLPRHARLRRIELPLAAPSILAGIKTSAVINVGTATLGALVGAGGYGQPILTGIRLDDMTRILEGAVPAALLALLVQGVFELLEHAVVPRGLRLAARMGF